MKLAHRWMAAFVAGFALIAGSAAPAAADKGKSQEALDAAFANSDRPAADAAQDERRQSRKVLALLDLKPGMHVIDLFSASGYNTELLARAVGVKGEVIAYNNPPYAKFAEKGIAARYAGGRLSNVKQITAETGDLNLPPNSLDAGLCVMSYHDLYWRPADGSCNATSADTLLSKLYTALKPGGVVVVQDHVANPGGDPAEVVEKLHRIDPALVRRDFEKAGFVFVDSSKVLAHPADDHTKLVFDEAIRGKTDQFVYRFRKPMH